MTEKVQARGAATRRYALTSAELTEVIAVRGTAKILEEKPIELSGASAPSLYQRRFTLTNMDVIHGNPTLLDNGSQITFSGFTMLASTQRILDSRSPTLRLEGQAYFDSKLSPDSMDVLLLIGRSEIDPIAGFMGHSAVIESDAYKGHAVRAFLVEGADATLPSDMPLLVGWQPQPTIDTARTAIMASHPLIAVDALRIAARSGIRDQVELLARWLLHPAQPVGVRITAIELLGQAINQVPQGSPEADALIGITVAGWETERAYPLDAAYLRALQSASQHIKRSSRLQQIETIADDYSIRELSSLSEQLTDSLKE